MSKLLFALIPALGAFVALTFFIGPILAGIFASCIFGFGLDVLSDGDSRGE